MRVETIALVAFLILPEFVFASDASHFNYMLHCQGCHLADGSGHEPGVPSIVDRLGSMLEVPGGRAFLVQVPGTAQAPLNDADVAALLNWVLYQFNVDSLPANFEPYTAEEIAEFRLVAVSDIAAERRRILSVLNSR